MYCKNCGNFVESETKFCNRCGNQIITDIIITNENEKKKNIVAIIGFVFSFIIALIGLILSIIGLKKSKILNSGKGLSIAGIIISSLSMLFALIIVIFGATSNAIGDWQCKGLYGTGEGDQYLINLNLYKDNTFEWNQYDNPTNNYLKGNFTIEDLNKKSKDGKYIYYTLTLNGNVYVSNGISKNPSQTVYEIGINSYEKHAILYNQYSMNMYSCYKK